MDTSFAQAALEAARVYALVGGLVALPFVLVIAPRIDAGARGSSLVFRAMLLPGAILLWPIVIARSIAKARRSSEGHP